MKRSLLLRDGILCAPAETAAAGAPPASNAPGAPAAPEGASAKGAVRAPVHTGLNLSDLTALAEANPENFDTSEAAGEDEGGPADPAKETKEAKADKAQAEAEAKAKAEVDAKAEADAKPKAEAKAKAEADAKAKADKEAEASKTIELNAEQTAWVEKRLAAKTEDEAKALDAAMPTFTDAEWKEVERRAQAAPAGESEQAGEQETPEAQLATERAATATAKAEAEAATKRAQELEAKLAAAEAKPMAVAPLNPLLMLDARGLDRAEAEAAAVKKWALKNWDGSQAVEANGNQPAVPAYSAEEVRAAYERADEQLARGIPTARGALQEHAAASTAARTVYPELFDAQSPHSQTVKTILRQLPGVPAILPHIHTVMGDAILGEQLRGLIFTAQPTPATVALAEALVKAAPELAKFLPQLTKVKAGPNGRPGMRLPAEPIVPLARPAPGGGSPLGLPKRGPSPQEVVKQFAQARTENGGDDLAALTETMRGFST